MYYNICVEGAPMAVRRAFSCAIDKALADTVRDILGEATPDELSSHEAWMEAFSTIQCCLESRVEGQKTVRGSSGDGVSVSEIEVEVMRYEIGVHDNAYREVVMTYKAAPPRFYIRTSLVNR